MSDVVGLSLGQDHLDCAVVRRRFGRIRVLGTFRLGLDGQVGTELVARIREHGTRTRHAHVAIPRRLAIVKTIELPGIAGVDLRRMVGFELERHLPFPPSEALFDFDVLEQKPGRPVRVLLVAVERRVVDQLKQLLREAGMVPRLVDVGIHGLALLLGRRSRGSDPQEGRAVVKLDETEAELAIVRRGRLLASRAVPVPSDPVERARVLDRELARTLAGLASQNGNGVADVVVTGSAFPFSECAELPVRAGTPLDPSMTTVEDSFLPALAMAVRRPTRGASRINLVPDELRPKPFPWRIGVTASLAAATLLLLAAIPVVTVVRAERIMAKLDRRVARLAPDVRSTEQLASAVERARLELETLRTFEGQSVPVLSLLRELTELLPPDAWLTNLTADRNGIELTGFAGAASQLIPLLEASPRLERAEFTSPVTKGRDREQFRLKATWERPGGTASTAQPAVPPPRPRPSKPQTGR